MKEGNSLNKYLLLAVFALLFLLSIYLSMSLLGGIVWGFIIGFGFLPLNRFINRKIKNIKIASAITTSTIILIIVVPIALFLQKTIIGFITIYPKIDHEGFGEMIYDLLPSIAPYLQSITETVLAALVALVSELIMSLPSKGINVFIAIVITYFILKESDDLANRIKQHAPMNEKVTEMLFERSKQILNGTVYGIIAISVLISILGYIGFVIFGVPYPWFFAFLMLIVGILPMVGPALVYIPLVIYLIYIGEKFNGIGLLIYSIILLSILVDTFLKTRLISNKTKIHPVISLIGIFGGISAFGVSGIILGPLILSFLILFFEIYFNRGKI